MLCTNPCPAFSKLAENAGNCSCLTRDGSASLPSSSPTAEHCIIIDRTHQSDVSQVNGHHLILLAHTSCIRPLNASYLTFPTPTDWPGWCGNHSFILTVITHHYIIASCSPLATPQTLTTPSPNPSVACTVTCDTCRYNPTRHSE